MPLARDDQRRCPLVLAKVSRQRRTLMSAGAVPALGPANAPG